MTTPALSADCAALAEALDPYLDGELSPAETAAVEAHAAACPACAAELVLAGRTLAALRATPAEACPNSVFAAALARIEALPPVAPITLRRAPDRAPRSAPVRVARVRWAVAAVLVLAPVAVLLLRPAPPSPAPAAPLAEHGERPTAATPAASPPALAEPAPVAVARPPAPRPVASLAPALAADRPPDALATDALPSDTAAARRAQAEVLLALALVADAQRATTHALRDGIAPATVALRLPRL